MIRCLTSKIVPLFKSNLQLQRIQLNHIMSMSTEKSRNIEIKARINSKEEFDRRIQIAKDLTGTEGETIHQRDVFFNATNGRLKLRYLQNQPSQLIYYNRPNTEGPKLSQYTYAETNQPDKIEEVLTDSIGTKGIVKKTRYLYMHEQTRIHFDDVDKLGLFMEFEVILQPNETTTAGTTIAEKLMTVFGIKDEDLMEGAYMDELIKLKN